MVVKPCWHEMGALPRSTARAFLCYLLHQHKARQSTVQFNNTALGSFYISNTGFSGSSVCPVPGFPSGSGAAACWSMMLVNDELQ